jgi:tetratricopeptide (TPR) repeat protein
MDLDNPVIKLCIEGTRAEFEGRIEDARALFMRAWEASRDDFDACVSAHYVARHQEEPEETLRWNQEALNRARAVKDGRVQDFYPSLYLSLGHSHEMLGHQAEAQRYYQLAAELGVVHQAGEQNRNTPYRGGG